MFFFWVSVVVFDKSAPKKRKEEVTLTTLHSLLLFHSSLMDQNSLYIVCMSVIWNLTVVRYTAMNGNGTALFSC